MGAAETQLDFAPHLENCFLFEAVEASYQVTGIAGRIPAWLEGSYYVNGPARFERQGLRYRHWLDGDGMVCALHFTPDGVQFTNRFVRTRKLCDEEAAGAPVYRAFGTAFPGDRLRREIMLQGPVNVSVYPYAGTLLAFGEQMLPVELDPLTLDTRGDYDFHGRLNDVSPFGAHAKFDPLTGHMWNFGTSYSATQPALHVYEFDARGGLLARRRTPLGAAHSIHDFGLSARHVVFFVSPLIMDLPKFVREGVSVYDALSWRPEMGSRILVVPRAAGADAFAVDAGRGYCLHVVNAFEDDNRLAIDVIELDGPIYSAYEPVPHMFAAAPAGRPVRYWIDVTKRSLLERIAMPYEQTPDFPSIDPRRSSLAYDEFWLLGLSAAGRPGRKFFDQLARGSWRSGSVEDVYQTAPGEYLCGEPVFVPNPDAPGEGVVIVQRFTARTRTVEFALFDAFSLRSGPLARLPLKHPIHPGFHASFLGRTRASNPERRYG